MRSFKKVLTTGIASVLVLTALACSASAATTKFTDVNKNDATLTEAVSLLEGLGVAKGTTETTFGTNESVTRQQMAAFVYRLLKGGKSLEGGENTTRFEDLYDDTYYSYISWCDAMGIIKGVSETEFNPDGGIILQDAYTMLVRALGYEKKETLDYPHDFIDIAESKGVRLDKGLSSSVTYEKELTRGNVAVLLYNAFYAETGEVEVKQVPRLVGKNSSEGKQRYVLEEVEDYPALCEKAYNVLEEEFIVRETEHYAFNDAKDDNTYEPLQDAYEEGTIHLVSIEDEPHATDIYATVEELGFEGKGDSYIMSNVKVYYSFNEDKQQVKKIYIATPLMQTATSTSASYSSYSVEKTAKNKSVYFYGSDFGYPKMDGGMTVAGKQLWFENAPYSFLKPSYNGLLTEEEMYEARNEDDTKMINLLCLDPDEGLYSYYFETDTASLFNPMIDTPDFDNRLNYYFSQVRTGGIYTMDIYDPDGDGHYEYMWYKPATFGQIVMDKDYKFSDYEEYTRNAPVIVSTDSTTTTGKKPVLYANGATITGAAFHDEDFVAAYVNGDANMIHVFGSAAVKQGTITAISNSSQNAYFNLGNLNCVSYAMRLYVTNYYLGDSVSWSLHTSSWDLSHLSSLITTAAINQDYKIWVYSHAGRNNSVYFEKLSGGVDNYGGDPLLIPLEAETMTDYDAKTHKNVQYLKCWVDGAVKYIPVNVDIYPAPEKTIDGTYLFDVKVKENNGRSYYAYLDKLCTYEVSKDGIYTITSLLHAQDEDGAADHLALTFDVDEFCDKKDTNQAGNDLEGDVPVRLDKYTSVRYQILDENDYSMAGTYGKNVSSSHWFDEVYLTDTTKFIIRENTAEAGDEPEYEFITYTGTQFPGTTDSYLKNVQYVIANREDSTTKANLILFYGEIEDGESLEFKDSASKSDWRIVRSSNPGKDGEDGFRYFYEVIDPTTGKVSENVKGSMKKSTASALESTDPLAPGTIVKMGTAGTINDKNDDDIEGVIDPTTNEGLALILDIDDEENIMEIDILDSTGEEHFTVDGEFYNAIEVDDKTTFVLMTYEKANKISTATIEALTYEDVIKGSKNLKAYNDKIESKKDSDKYETKYAEYMKAYITYTKKSKDEYPVADTVVIIVNPDEDVDLLDLD